MANIYGYIRVSTRDQNEDRQLIALRELKIPEKNIFMDQGMFLKFAGLSKFCYKEMELPIEKIL